jgi:hypothetical protein
MRVDLAARYVIGEPSYETEFIVYPADDKRLQRQVFIVVPDLSLKSDKLRMERVWLSVNEAEALPSLRFVEIVDLVPATAEDSDFYIVERRLEKTLRAFYEEQEVIAFDSAVEIVRQALEGLATLHGAGYAHNALTDTCLYVSDDYSGLAVKIGNLHLISPIGERIVPPYAPEFGPPEIYASGTFTASAAVDIYALGMIAYKLLLPSRTYADIFHSALIWDDEHNREQSWKNIHLDPAIAFPRLDTLNPAFPEKVASVIERMLARDPSGRPRDGVEALEEFRRATVGVGHYKTPMPQPPVPPEREKAAVRRWTPMKIGIAVIVAAVWVGVGALTIPKLLGPDPELVKQVELWRKEAETRQQSAIAVKAQERPQTDEAGKAYAEGVMTLDGGVAAVTNADYEKALSEFKAANAAFNAALVDIARDAATAAQKAAETAGGAAAPPFKEALAAMTAAGESLAVKKPGAAVKNFNTATAGFSALASALDAVAQAKTAAGERKKAAIGMGGEDETGFADAEGQIKAADGSAGRFEFDAAARDFRLAGETYAGIINGIMAAKPDAESLHAKATNLAADLARRAGADEPSLIALAPKLSAAQAVFAAQAYKRTIAAYRPLLDELQALSDRGFCPLKPAAGFTRVEAGQYTAGNIRLMTGSMEELGTMLGMVNGAITLQKPFCLQTEVVTRGDIAAFYKAKGDVQGAGLYQETPEAPAEDVPQPIAEEYVRWFSKTNRASFRLPSAQEWITGAGKINPPAASDGLALQWSGTPCQTGGHIAFLAQDSMSFAVCSDDGTGGYLRLAADAR